VENRRRQADGVTTDLVRTYDRTGKLLTVTDATGTRSFAYYDTWSDDTYDNDLRNKSTRLKSETLPAGFFGSTHNILSYDYQYQTPGRLNGAIASVKLGSGAAYTVAYGYDDTLRLNRVTYNDGTPFTYDYVPGSNLPDTVGQAGGYGRDYDYRTDSNRLDKVKHSWSNLAPSQLESRLDYDLVGRRQTEKTQGAGFLAALGRPGAPGVHSDYTYTDRSEVDSSAKYALTANWLVGAALAGTGRDYDYDPIGNRNGTYGYAANSLNQYTAAPGQGAFSYDANGNLTGDGTRSYAYDAENRLITVTQGGASWSYVYDYLGRRVQKSGTGLATTRYLYDGWNPVAELDASGNLQRRFAWGLDVSGTLQGAGGVGGLLLIDTGPAQYWPVYDASHNVIALYHSGGGFAAAYEYDPFGNLQNAQGSYAGANPFGFSTKFTDAETGLVYYGMRYYSPTLGRFLNRDPIEEAGGLNLYAFCGNDGINRWDNLGMVNPDKYVRAPIEDADEPVAVNRGTRGSFVNWQDAYAFVREGGDDFSATGIKEHKQQVAKAAAERLSNARTPEEAERALKTLENLGAKHKTSCLDS
jgi:RHS repeat-associated protein